MSKKIEVPIEPEFYDFLVEKGLLQHAAQLLAGDEQAQTIARINAYWNTVQR